MAPVREPWAIGAWEWAAISPTTKTEGKPLPESPAPRWPAAVGADGPTRSSPWRAALDTLGACLALGGPLGGDAADAFRTARPRAAHPAQTIALPPAR